MSATVRERSGVWAEWAFPWHWGGGRALDWSVSLTRTIPLALDVHAGANQANLDLSDLTITELRVNTGASDTTVAMPAAGRTMAFVACGAASVRIRIPDGTAARIVVRAGLMSTKVDESRFPRAGNGFESRDFATAPDRVDLQVEGGAASLEVR